MQFSSPAYLFGLIAASAPVVIYLLLRRRKTEVPWGASYLLRRTLESKRKSSVWKQYLVLAMRCLLLALIVFAVSDPFQTDPDQQPSVPAPPPEPLHRVVLVDDSLSMSVTSGSASRLGRVKSVLRSLLTSQRPFDTTTLVSLAEPSSALSRAPIKGPLSPSEAAALLDSIQPKEGVLQLPSALARSVGALAATPEASAELYLLSDFPRELASDLSQLSWFGQAATERSIRVAPVSMTAPDTDPPHNLALLGATFGTDLVVRGIPATLYSDVVNHSDLESVARIRVRAEPDIELEKAVVLQPNEQKQMAFDVTFSEAGVESLQVTVSPSRLPAASRADLSVEVRKRLRVWVLADAPDPTKEDALGEAEFLRRALTESQDGEPSISVEEVELVSIARPIPEDVDVIVIAGPRVITPTVREPLLRFVRGGGGLVIAMSPSADTSFYNPNLKGLLPAELGDPSRGSIDPETFWSVKGLSESRPAGLFTEFAGDLNGELSTARVYSTVLAEEGEDASVIFRLTDGQPLLVEKGVGRGHVLLLTTSLGISWSSLPVRQSYLPLLHRMLNSAARGRGFARNLAAGQAFMGAWPVAEAITVTMPDQRKREVQPSEGPGGHFLVVDGLGQRGTYRVEGTSSSAETFTVSAEPPEADLRSLDGKERTELEELLGARIYADWPAAVSGLGAGNRLARLWHWLLIAVLGLYLLEAWFVRFL